MKQRTRKELSIAKCEQSAAYALPPEQQPPALFGRMKGTVEILGDIVASTGAWWQADEQ